MITKKLLKSDKVNDFQITEARCKVSITEEVRNLEGSTRGITELRFPQLIETRKILLRNQQNHLATRGFHGAIIYEIPTENWFFCEDIGRHNAVDKVIGNFVEKSYVLFSMDCL